MFVLRNDFVEPNRRSIVKQPGCFESSESTSKLVLGSVDNDLLPFSFSFCLYDEFSVSKTGNPIDRLLIVLQFSSSWLLLQNSAASACSAALAATMTAEAVTAACFAAMCLRLRERYPRKYTKDIRAVIVARRSRASARMRTRRNGDSLAQDDFKLL